MQSPFAAQVLTPGAQPAPVAGFADGRVRLRPPTHPIFGLSAANLCGYIPVCMDWARDLLWSNGDFLGIEWNTWKVIGWLGNAVFFSRFFVQWYATEKCKQDVVPVAFWWLSLAGSFLLLAYAWLYRKDSVFTFAYIFTWIPYVRNLMIHRRHRRLQITCPGCDWESPPTARYCSAPVHRARLGHRRLPRSEGPRTALAHPIPVHALPDGKPVVLRPRIGRRFSAIADFYDFFHATLRDRRAIGTAFLLSLMIQALTILEVYGISRGLGQHPSFTALFVFVPLIITVMAVPVSISGLGLRVGAFVVLFGLTGISAEASTSISFLWFLSIAAASLLGLVEYVRFRRQPPAV